MLLENYKSIKEKDKFFNNQACKEPDVFWDTLIDLDNENREADKKLFVFRGLSNAKYKLYNSAQRFVIEQDLFNFKKDLNNTNVSAMNLIVELTDKLKQGCEVWKGGVIQKYLDKPINLSDKTDESEYFTYLSYLRHHNVPTPVIDVSNNPFVALYFAISNLHECNTNEEIDKYFSFYVFNLHLLNKFEQEHKQLRTFESNLYDKYQTVRNVQIYSMLNNLNIINQEGCLISNISINPLEVEFDNIKKTFIKNKLKAELIEKRK